ncbi:hypothetical protein [Microbispora sp. H11081]|uniref:hypothetical protein n=1 Tax=Microbispora sp. H11081 TaxID=2729107 RepID=UPI00147388F8|nr:hypothetical protein [Microbispora sp. H11081]
MARTPLRVALVVAALAAGLSACQAPSPGPRTPPASPTGSPASGGAVYVTGAKAGDDPCARVVSAIGYVGLTLLPPGQEEAQHWDGGVRGRFGYLRGTLEMYGPRLPASAADAVAAIDAVAQTLSLEATAAARRPGLVRRYRAASAAVLAACGRS